MKGVKWKQGGTSDPAWLPNGPPLLPSLRPVPLALPRPTPHLRRRTLQGVAVQQDDLQVPEAAEGDRDAGDAVTGEIQAHKRKVPQLWGRVGKSQKYPQSGLALCSLPLPSALAHLQASPPPRGLTSAPACPRCLLLFSSLPTPDSNCSFILTSPKPTGTLLRSKTFHDLQVGLLRVSGLCPTQGHPGSVQSHLPCPWARLCLPIGRGASVYFSKRHC